MDNKEQQKKGRWLTWIIIIIALATIGTCMGDDEKSDDDKFIEYYNDFANRKYIP